MTMADSFNAFFAGLTLAIWVDAAIDGKTHWAWINGILFVINVLGWVL